MRTIFFEDNGQDFLEWDIDDNGVVKACRPLQEELWLDTKVISANITPGMYITIHTSIGSSPRTTTQLKHKVKAVSYK